MYGSGPNCTVRSFFALTDLRTTCETYSLESLLEEVHCKLRREADVDWFRPRSLLIGSAADVQLDTFQASRCRMHLRSMSPCARMSLQPIRLLNPHEQRRLRVYMSRWSQNVQQGFNVCDWEDLVCHLGDSPDTGWCTWSAASGRIPTLRRSGGLFWNPAANRQMLITELYCSMGFAALSNCAVVAGVAPYRVWHPGTSYSQVRAALGNSQHVANVGVFTVCAMACTTRTTP